jgi:hypothetical protein
VCNLIRCFVTKVLVFFTCRWSLIFIYLFARLFMYLFYLIHNLLISLLFYLTFVFIFPFVFLCLSTVVCCVPICLIIGLSLFLSVKFYYCLILIQTYFPQNVWRLKIFKKHSKQQRTIVRSNDYSDSIGYFKMNVFLFFMIKILSHMLH